MFSNCSCSHISDNIRAWKSCRATQRGIFSGCIFSLSFSLPVFVSLQDALPTFYSILQHSFSVIELFYPTCLWSFMDGPILLHTPLELGSDIQATKALNGTHPSPGSSSAHALMLQSLPSRPFLAYRAFLLLISFSGLLQSFIKPVLWEKIHSADTWLYPQSVGFLSGNALPRLQVTN